MMRPSMKFTRALALACLLASGALIAGCATTGGREPTANALAVIIAGSHRSAADRSRDRYRHPEETLLFFGIRPNERVLQVWPESGWYTKIIAPLVRAKGGYLAGVMTPDPGSRFLQERSANYRRLLASRPDLYGSVKVAAFPLDGGDVVPPGSVDMVLSFRDLHEWMALGDAQQALATIYRALAPGGVFGVVDNRGDPGVPQDPRAKSGYVRQDYAIRMIEAAGFRLVATSEVNANPMDTKSYPAGVWTLPPDYRLGNIDRGRYEGIGESDRFTLKFVKP
ncbi:MAG: class I SAM-dependent methyltransferase, partial [Gammaproteobacteria bacterium]|nr:class I SAM-dependent methyltransferase [Gammaproteobacteria bacterium]